MSWTRVARPYKAFEEAADGENGTHLATFLLDVWDSGTIHSESLVRAALMNPDNPNGTWDRDITDLDRLKSKPPLRIMSVLPAPVRILLGSNERADSPRLTCPRGAPKMPSSTSSGWWDSHPTSRSSGCSR